jgi:hypothetical protein
MCVVFAAGAGLTGYRLFLASGTCSTAFHRCPEARDDPEYGHLNAQLSLELGLE